MDALTIFNSIEAAFWISVGMTVWGKNRQPSLHQRLAQFAAIWFVLFGISDIIEVYTGAWWRPFSLLVFKGACLTALVTCAVVYARTQRLRRVSKRT